MPEYFDSHTHIQFAAYNNDRDEVIKRALEKGVWLVNVGTQQDTSRAAVELTMLYEGVYAIIGLHPIHTQNSFHDPNELGIDVAGGKGFSSRGEIFNHEFYYRLGQNSKVLGIGECGLDYFRTNESDEKSKKLQKDVFEKHIDLACDLKKPLMCHVRPSPNSYDAYEDIYEIVKKRAHEVPAIIIHFYCANERLTEKFLSLNCYFTFGGVITFSRDYDSIVNMIPLDKILLETDSPYITPMPYRGKRNEPLYILETYKKMADLKKMPEDSLRKMVLENNKKVFSLEF